MCLQMATGNLQIFLLFFFHPDTERSCFRPRCFHCYPLPFAHKVQLSKERLDKAKSMNENRCPEATKVLEEASFPEKRRRRSLTSLIGGASLLTQRGLSGFSLSGWSQRWMFRCWPTLINHKIPLDSVSFSTPENPMKGTSSTSIKHFMSLGCLCVFCFSYPVLVWFLHTQTPWSQGSNTAPRWCNPDPYN